MAVDARSVEYARGHTDGYYNHAEPASMYGNAEYMAGRQLGARERKQDDMLDE